MDGSVSTRRKSWSTAYYETIHPRETCIIDRHSHLACSGSVSRITTCKLPSNHYKNCLANCRTYRWPIYLIGLSWTIPNNPATSYLTLQLKANGFGTFQTNLLTIPAYVLFIVQLLFWTWVSEKVNQRFIVGLVSQIWVLPLLIALELIPGSTSAWTKWALSTLLVGYPYVHAILVSTSSRNAGSVRLRTVASAFYNMCVQTASIIGSNVRAFHIHSKEN